MEWFWPTARHLSHPREGAAVHGYDGCVHGVHLGADLLADVVEGDVVG